MDKIEIIGNMVEWMEKEKIPPEKIIECIKYLREKKKKVVAGTTTKNEK